MSARLTVNPFEDAYWQAELKAYGLEHPRSHGDGDMTVDWFQIQGRCDDYLNINMRFEDTWLPRLCLNKRLWMSLTPMEIQSAALAIHRSHGRVLCGGLGLGYYALRAAARPQVSEVVVWEVEPRVIHWFEHTFAGRPELAKIKLRQGDLRTLKDEQFDFAFVDIYQTMLPDELLADASKLCRNNKIGRYHPWGYEKVLLEALLATRTRRARLNLKLAMDTDLSDYFRKWATTPVCNDTLPMNLNRHPLDPPYVRKAVKVLGQFPL